MKKHLLLLILLLLLLSLAVSCTSLTGTKESESSTSTESHTPITGDTDSSTTLEDKISSSSEEPTPDPNALITLPKEYYENPDQIYNGSKIVIPAALNRGLAFDVYPVIDGDTVYFLLPSAVDLRQVAYQLLDSKGNYRIGRCADFTNDTDTGGKRISIFGDQYDIVAIRSDSPTLYLEIDEDYGTLDDVKADQNKNTKAYGTFVLECREDIAALYGWKTHYESIENDPDSPCTAYIKGRGNWTWDKTDKQGYSIKLEKKTSLLEMGKSKKWALIGNVPDNTMLRNTLAYYLGKEVGLDYSPEGEIVDFFVNGEYQGAYLLSEKIDVEEERVNIADLEGAIEQLDPTEDHGKQRTQKLYQLGITVKYYTGVENPDDITGGYIIEQEMSDRYQKEPCGFITSRGNYYVIKTPEYVSYEQAVYIATLVQEMETALYAKEGYNTKTGKHYTEYIDLDSLVKKYLVEEISKNHDGAKTSQYFYKPADHEATTLFAGPVWDYDIAFGISSETTDPKGWFMRTEKEFYKRCWQHGDFQERVKTVFLEDFVPAIMEFANVLADKEADKIYQSVQMNNIVWHQFSDDYYHYVEWLKNYLLERMRWLYSQLV